MNKSLDERRKATWDTEVSGNAVERFKRTRAYERLTQHMCEDGNRYHESSSIIGVMIKYGLTVDEGLALFDEYATYGKSFNPASIQRMFRQFS